MDREELRKQLMATFQVQLGDHARTLNKGLLELEKGPSGKAKEELMAELFRAAHSVKGAAHAVKLNDIETIAHRIEDVFVALKGGEILPVPELIDLLLPAVDALGEAMDAHMRGERISSENWNRISSTIEAALRGEMTTGRSVGDVRGAGDTDKEKTGAAEIERDGDAGIRENSDAVKQRDGDTKKMKSDDGKVAEVPKRIASPRVTGDSIRVATEKMDALMDGMGELLVARMRTEQRLDELKDLQGLLSVREKVWRKFRNQYRRVDRQVHGDQGIQSLMEFLIMNERHFKEVGAGLNRLFHRFEGDYRHMALLTDEMQNGVRKIRMVPISSLFEMFPRMVRDLGRRKSKDVNLIVEGADTEIDRQVLEAMKDPLTHLVRNAVDHGIEAPEGRTAAGKSRQGTIYLRAFPKGNSIVLEIADDGGGIDLMAVRRAAISTGLLDSSTAESLSSQESMDLIFQSGLSTMARTTDLSGRGIGMDVVRKNLEHLNGKIEVDTAPGKGTTFSLILPLTLATSHVLLLEAGGQTVSVPITAVERILHVQPKDIGSVEGKPAISMNGKTIPMVSMARILELPQADESEDAEVKIPVVILGAVEKKLAFKVDKFMNTQEIVIKNLGRQLNRVRHVSGATILGTGQVVMILNVASMIKSGQDAPTMTRVRAGEIKKAVQRRILVVDDSITTRTLEKNILENAGYHVFTASDGVEGWGLIQSEPFDAAVLDVDMPRMNGFELTDKVKMDERLGDLPVILVTSLESPQDKIRGMEAGADAYITKGAFDQQELLEAIERLIG